MKYLNLGCGNRFSEDWVNIDFVRSGLNVKSYNLLEGIPYPDKYFDVVYHSHVLEHFNKKDAVYFINECYRVLKPNGVIRVVIPDLEQIVKEYLKNLEGAKSGDEWAKVNYEWIMLELYDQAVRNISGGEMAEYWERTIIENEQYVESRMGKEFVNFRKGCLRRKFSSPNSEWKKYFRLSNYKNRLLNFLGLGGFVNIGLFRTGGEVHQWMYDEYSLGELLKGAGFNGIEKMSAFESEIPFWEKYGFLDVENGRVRKPDSLFLEAFK